MYIEDDIREYTKAFQRGEEKGFTFFFNSLYPALFYFAFKLLKDKPEAEDIVEEAFIKIWDRHNSFNHPQVIKSWLYTTVRNACIDKLKKLQRDKRNEIKIVAQAEDNESNNPLNNIILAEVIAQIHSTLQVLPPECRKIFEMMYVEGKTVREIAEELQLSISTIKNQKARGLEILRKKFPQLSTVVVLEALNIL